MSAPAPTPETVGTSGEGPEDGHTFRFWFDIRGSSRVVGDLEYSDAPDFMGPVHEIQVRAWSLTEALRKAATLPFPTLMGTEVSEDAMVVSRPDDGCDVHRDQPKACYLCL